MVGCLRSHAVQRGIAILSRGGLLTLRVLLCACGGVAAAFVLALIFARPASAAQNPVQSGTAAASAVSVPAVPVASGPAAISAVPVQSGAPATPGPQSQTPGAAKAWASQEGCSRRRR